jgi:hypothetical protein
VIVVLGSANDMRLSQLVAARSETGATTRALNTSVAAETQAQTDSTRFIGLLLLKALQSSLFR